jgi:hypothetical protein
MNASDRNHATNLRAALLALPASGSGGFEGLVGVILGQLTGQSFRLATSGTQRGRDGDSAFDGGATYFEAKRYKDEISRSDIAVKFFDLSNDDAGKVDLWILGATCEVGAQLATDIRRMAEGAASALRYWIGWQVTLARCSSVLRLLPMHPKTSFDRGSRGQFMLALSRTL